MGQISSQLGIGKKSSKTKKLSKKSTKKSSRKLTKKSTKKSSKKSTKKSSKKLYKHGGHSHRTVKALKKCK
jgi:hypothetical protein